MGENKTLDEELLITEKDLEEAWDAEGNSLTPCIKKIGKVFEYYLNMSTAVLDVLQSNKDLSLDEFPTFAVQELLVSYLNLKFTKLYMGLIGKKRTELIEMLKNDPDMNEFLKNMKFLVGCTSKESKENG